MKKIKFEPSGIVIEAEDSENVFHAALRNGFIMKGECGGKGVCGKCTCIADGKETLACLYSPSSDSVINADLFLQGEILEILDKKLESDINSLIHEEYFLLDIGEFRDYMSSFKAAFPNTIDPDYFFLKELSFLVGNEKGSSVLFFQNRPVSICKLGKRYSIGVVDIGTTSVKCAIVDLKDKSIKALSSALNIQRKYGTDLISRIIACKDKLDEMADSVWNSIKSMFMKMSSSANIDFPSIILISANTVMSSIFSYINPDSIRKIPGGPVSSSLPFIRKEGIPCFFVPAAAGFVGGDVVSGCVSVELCHSEEPSMLIDLGTNGEIALGCSDWIGVCSASAGPAFEGGGIKCGMIASNGAISHVDVNDYDIKLNVIGGGTPLGICSSGVISLISGLFKNGMLDRSGKFTEKAPIKEGKLIISESNEVFIDEDDIANILRAKAAIFAGAEALINTFGLTFGDLKKVYIAGSVSEYLNIADCFEIGLLPPVGFDKIEIVGNTSLFGSLKMIFSEEKWKEAEKISEESLFVDLVSDMSFMDRWRAALFIPHTDNIYGVENEKI